MCGSTPAYADYVVFGAFQWARAISDFEVLAADDRSGLGGGACSTCSPASSAALPPMEINRREQEAGAVPPCRRPKLHIVAVLSH